MKALLMAAVVALAFGSAGAIAVSAPTTPMVNSHGGGTDDLGCHTNHKTGVYHCH